MYTGVPLGGKICTRILAWSLLFISTHLLFYFCFIIFSVIIPHPSRKTANWVMSNNFVIKCCSSVFIESLSTLMNSSVPRDRYNHSWLTFLLQTLLSPLPVRCFLRTPHLYFFPLFFYVQPYECFSPSGTKCSVKDSRNQPSTTK